MQPEEGHTIIPNTTQIPHLIIRIWMPRLRDVELRVLLVVADQTLGWIEDAATGRRKERDWINHYQLRKKTGRGDRAISKAVKTLIETHSIVEAYDEQGNPLDTAEKRRMVGYRIYYRLNLRHPPISLFDTPAKSAGVGGNKEKRRFLNLPPQKVRTQKVRTTKETVLTKTFSRTAEPPAGGKLEKSDERPKTDEANVANVTAKSDHRRLIEFWYETVKATRGFKPRISPADAKNLKRILNLNILALTDLEKLAYFFLSDRSFIKFSPSISTFLSAGILNGLQNRMENDSQHFWEVINTYRKPTQTDSSTDMLEKLRELKSLLFRPAFTPQVRTAIQEQVAREERAAKI